MVLKKRSRPMTTRQFAAGPHHILTPTVQPTPLVVDCRKKRTPGTEMKLFSSSRKEATLEKMSKLVAKEAHHSSL
uniref:Uncharacterized protein n=1 Tax=Meloidogyne enterolobii TaxID=390850 RepID=A0A6V7Y3S7_MELEN|nr:unnamed protein product [Meloidogyne enterolobii]